MFKFSKKFLSLIMAILMLTMTAIGVNAEELITGTTDLLVDIGIIDPSPEEELMPMAANTCYVTLSNNFKRHISKHIVSEFAKQVPNLTEEELSLKLSGTTFFNTSWDADTVYSIVETAYNDLLRDNSYSLSPGHYNVGDGDDSFTIYIDNNGIFKTAYGHYQLAPSYFL